MGDAVADKQTLRRAMRAMRRELPDLDQRSARLWDHVRARPEFAVAQTVMVFDSVRGEPVTSPFMERARAAGKVVVVPEQEVDPTTIDLVLVPGTAFTADGHRLGQGGGWYDRFLPQLRDDCPAIGVGFEPQLLAELPTEPHDALLDLVITDAGVAGSG